MVEIPKAGDPISADWAAELIEFIEAKRSGGGSSIQTSTQWAIAEGPQEGGKFAFFVALGAGGLEASGSATVTVDSAEHTIHASPLQTETIAEGVQVLVEWFPRYQKWYVTGAACE